MLVVLWETSLQNKKALAMRGFIFRCNDKTESEVLEKSLLGEEMNYFGLINPISSDDVLFLYSTTKYTITGPLKPNSELKLNIEKSAWNGLFPTQIRYIKLKNTKTIEFRKIEKFIKIYLHDVYPYPVIEEKNLAKILNEFNNCAN